MDAYEKIISIMRNQGAVKNPIGLQLAEMTDATSCDIGELHLEAEDLFISQHLTDYEIEIELSSGNKKDAIAYGHLKKGDIVLIQRMSDEKYVIVEKILEAADEN